MPDRPHALFYEFLFHHTGEMALEIAPLTFSSTGVEIKGGFVIVTLKIFKICCHIIP
ncbi:Uncharacterised protein [Chlamydia trachomatis]|nr:Uncharacterised protein [Chlamydia trachomatis]